MFVRIDGACSVQRLVQIFLCLGVVAHLGVYTSQSNERIHCVPLVLRRLQLLISLVILRKGFFIVVLFLV